MTTCECPAYPFPHQPHAKKPARKRAQRRAITNALIDKSHCPTCDMMVERGHDCRLFLDAETLAYRQAYPEWRLLETAAGQLLVRYDAAHIGCEKGRGWCLDPLAHI